MLERNLYIHNKTETMRPIVPFCVMTILIKLLPLSWQKLRAEDYVTSKQKPDHVWLSSLSCWYKTCAIYLRCRTTSKIFHSHRPLALSSPYFGSCNRVQLVLPWLGFTITSPWAHFLQCWGSHIKHKLQLKFGWNRCDVSIQSHNIKNIGFNGSNVISCLSANSLRFLNLSSQ